MSDFHRLEYLLAANSAGDAQATVLGLMLLLLKKALTTKVGLVITGVLSLFFLLRQPIPKEAATPGVDLEPGYEHVELSRPFPFNLLPRSE